MAHGSVRGPPPGAERVSHAAPEDWAEAAHRGIRRLDATAQSCRLGGRWRGATAGGRSRMQSLTNPDGAVAAVSPQFLLAPSAPLLGKQSPATSPQHGGRGCQKPASGSQHAEAVWPETVAGRSGRLRTRRWSGAGTCKPGCKERSTWSSKVGDAGGVWRSAPRGSPSPSTTNCRSRQTPGDGAMAARQHSVL